MDVTKIDFRSGKQSTLNDRTDAVFGSPAQITELEHKVRQVLSEIAAVEINWASQYLKDVNVNLAIYLQSVYSLRISEVLEINQKNLIQGLGICIISKKGSAPLVIRDLFLYDFIRSILVNQYDLFYGVNRSYLYRCYKDIGIRSVSSGKHNRAVTHAFRHINAKRLRKSGADNSLVTSLLHHKSNKSQSYYGKD